MSFQLSSELDKNKVFLVKRSELEGRLDTVFYHPKYMINEGAIKNSKWGFEKVDHIASRIADGPFGSDLKVDEYCSEGNPLLRVSNIRTGEVAGKLVYISDEKQKQLKRSKVYPNDVLLTKAGAILGYSAVFPESMKEGNITSHLVTITCRDGIDPHYLSHFFRSDLGQLQIYRWGNKSTRPELNTGEVENILITTPPRTIQNDIVEKLNTAYAAKKHKEAEAQQLLDSIDDYLLAELGIELPEQTENTLQSRIFTRKLSEVSGGRFDAFFNMPLFSEIERNIFSGKFDCMALDELVFPVAGVTYKATDERMSGHVILRANNISLNNNELNFNNLRFIDRDINISQSSKLYKNDILMSSASGSKEHVGKVAFIENDMDYYFGAFMTVLRAKTPNYCCNYLFNFLSSNIYRLMLFRYLGGTNINNVGFEKIKNFLIPLPPIGKQTEIANHIAKIRNQSKQLQQKANAELEQTKKAVEAMILGEA
jgi:type I restriction enzyme S subunit